MVGVGGPGRELPFPRHSGWQAAGAGEPASAFRIAGLLMCTPLPPPRSLLFSLGKEAPFEPLVSPRPRLGRLSRYSNSGSPWKGWRTPKNSTCWDDWGEMGWVAALMPWSECGRWGQARGGELRWCSLSCQRADFVLC